MFELYPHQVEASNVINNSDVNLIVETPTGSGKSIVASFAIKKALREGKKVIYTSPLKALSTQKYKDYIKEFPDNSVGLMTGDFTLNRNANIIVMTAEILRNMLINDTQFLLDVSYIILDEFHFINDKGRGSTWEEIIMYSPKTLSIICLSATFPNSEEIKDWVSKVHKEVYLIKSDFRPVPLTYYYYDNKELRELNLKKSIPQVNKEFDLNIFLKTLKEKNMLPCIFFSFNRLNCNEYANEVTLNLLTPEEKKECVKEINLFCDKYKFFKKSFLKKTLTKGVAVHHAGLLPQVKLFIEQLYLKKLIKVVFATETLSAGINMPARTTILSKLNKWSDDGDRPITISEFRQMSGRAGRKGFDDTGNVIIIGNTKNTDINVKTYLTALPDKVNSNLKITYNALTNKLHKRSIDDFHTDLSNSFLVYQENIVNNVNYCSTYTDYKFKKYLNYCKILEKNKGKYTNKIITYKELSRKNKIVLDKLKNYRCGKCPRLSNHIQYLEYKREQKLSLTIEEQINSRVSVLSHYKYLDKNKKLTWSGKLLKDINFQNELFILELFLSGILDTLHYDKIVPLLATVLLDDKHRNFKYKVKKKTQIKEELDKVKSILKELKTIEGIYNIETNISINTTFTELASEWVCGASWESLVLKGLDENYSGDFFRLIRTIINILKQLNKIIKENQGIFTESLKNNIDLALMCIDRDVVSEI